MTSYFIDPKAPLLFGDGRPFGATECAETLPFPLPSTVAGAMRTAYAEQRGMAFAGSRETLLSLPIAGPLLASRSLANPQGDLEVYLPKPADAVYFKIQDQQTEDHKTQDQKPQNPLLARRLRPGEITVAGAGTDLPHNLLPVFLSGDNDKSKPGKGPTWWRLQQAAQWLADDRQNSLTAEDPKDLGVDALPMERRTHVALDPDTLTNRDGQLFQTAGLDFGPRLQSTGPRRQFCGWQSSTYGLLVQYQADGTETFLSDSPRMRTVGGERRPAWIEPAGSAWPGLPEVLSKALAQAQAKPASTGFGIRLMLVTPALFERGWLPGWLDESLQGSPPGHARLKLQLCAASLERWQPFSGWDLQSRNRHSAGAARAIRRMVPSGSLYWFKVLEGDADTIAKLWLSPVSDREQDCRDGFGLAAPGVWSTCP